MSRSVKNKKSFYGSNQFGILQEDNGNYSYTRLACFICVITGISIAFLSILNLWLDGIGYCIAFLGYGMGATSVHKIAEENVINTDNLKKRDRAGFFAEDNGNFSIVRATAFLTLISSIVITFLSLATNFEQGHSYVMTFLTVSFGGKTLTKVAERNMDGSQSIIRQYLNNNIVSSQHLAVDTSRSPLKENHSFEVEFQNDSLDTNYPNYDNAK